MTVPVSGQGTLHRCAAMQEYTTPATQTDANNFAKKIDVVWFGNGLSFLPGMISVNADLSAGPYNKGIMWQGTTTGNGLPTDFPEDWYTHSAIPIAKANRVPSTFGPTIWIMDPTSTAAWTDTTGEAGVVNKVYNGFRDFHKHWLETRILSNPNYEQTFADSVGTQSLNNQVNESTGVAETQTTWFNKLNDFFTNSTTGVWTYLKSKGYKLYPNGLVTNASTYNYGDGAMLENALRQPTDGTLATYSSTTLQSKFTTHGQRLMDCQLAGKLAFPLTQILSGSGMAAGSAAITAWCDYTAAAAYIFDLGKLYWDLNVLQDVTYDIGTSWSRNLSTPMDTTPPTKVADFLLATGTSGNLYGRRYKRGFALVNTSSAAISYTLPRADYLKAADGTAQAASISVPARAGIVLYATSDDPAASGGGGGQSAVMFGQGDRSGGPSNFDKTQFIQKQNILGRHNYITQTLYVFLSDLADAPTNHPMGADETWLLTQNPDGLATNCIACVGGRLNNSFAGDWNQPGAPPANTPGLQQIAAGTWDAEIDKWADALKVVPGNVWMRLWREMNNGSGPWYDAPTNTRVVGSAVNYVNAWRRVYNRFQARGATNVLFLWCPMQGGVGGPAHPGADGIAWYPGDAYVHWCGIDGYADTDKMYSLDTLFDNWYAAFNETTGTAGRKPLIICETAPTASPGTSSVTPSDWLNEWPAWLNSHPSVKAVAFWNEGLHPCLQADGASAATQATYLSIINNAPFTGTGPPPPPPPPPPPQGTLWDMDFGVNTPSTTPFGFDSIPNGVGSGAVLEVIQGTGTGGTARQSGVGVASSTVGTSGYTSEKTAGITKPGYTSIGINWYQIQPVQWNQYDTSALAGFDTLVDLAATEAAAGRPFNIGFRLYCGADAPVGGRDIDGTTLPNWMVGGPQVVNNNKATDYMIWASNDGGSRLSHVPIFWNPDFTYNDAYMYHYNNLMVWLNGYLNGLTAAGNRRGDYVIHVPVAAPTEVGTEMPIGFGSGAASFNPTVVINGVTYGNDTNGFPSIADIGVVNRDSSKNHMPASVAADTANAQNVWLANWYHNMSTATLGGAIAPGDGMWMRAIAIHMAQPNFDSSVAYGGIFSDNYVRGMDVLTRSAQYLKTRLWTGQTNLRVMPPNNDFSQPVSTWSYRNWSAAAADLMVKALTLSSPSTPLIFFQTANAVGYGGARGMPPSDFVQAATDGMNTYKMQFLETYSGVWTDATYGATNKTFINGTLQAGLLANAQAAAGGGTPRGELHVKEVTTVTTGPVARRLVPAGISDIWYRFVVDDLVTPSVISTILLSQPSGGSNNGDLTLRVNTSKQLVARWNAASAADWTDTVALAKGDVVDIRHVLNGATSGYEVWVNNVKRKGNLALSAPAASTITFVNLGLPNAATSEIWYYRFGAATQRMGTPTDLNNPTNTDSPVVAITNPANGHVYTSQTTITVSATATDNDGISKVEMRLDGGGWVTMSLSGSSYTASALLSGTAGQTQQHTIDVRATDAFSDTTQRLQTTASVTVSVTVPGADTTPPVLSVTTPSADATVSNATTTQAVAGSATDNVGVTSVTVNGVVQALSAGAFSTSVNLAVGSNVITVVAKDAAGNQTTITRTITRQAPVNTPPTVVISTPTAGQTFASGTTSVTLSGTATDDGTITALTYSLDGAANVALTLASGAYSQTVPITPGTHSIVVKATDNGGLTTSVTVNFTVTFTAADTTPPSLSVTTPSADATVSNATATQSVVGVATDNVAVASVTVNGQTQTVDGSGNFSTSIGLVVGANTITVVATDTSGNTRTVTRTITRTAVVNQPPVLTLNAPIDGQTYAKGTISIPVNGTSSDPDGTIQSVAYSLDGSAPTIITFNGGAFSTNISVSAGNHTLTVIATDNGGLTVSKSVNISIPFDVSTPPNDGGGSGVAIELDFGKGQALFRV